MTAAAGPIAQEFEITDKPVLPLGAGLVAHENTLACLDTAAGVIKPGVAGNANLVPIGTFLEETDNSGGSSAVGVVVQLFRHIRITYWANDTGTPIAALFVKAYILDNQTVTGTSNSGANSLAGVVWKIDSIKGIGVVSPPF